MRPRVFTALCALPAVAVLALPGGASAASTIGAAGHALQSDPVYVAPDAKPSLTGSQAQRLREMIRANPKRPIFIAVLNAKRAKAEVGTPQRLPSALYAATDHRLGTYAVVAGPVFRANNSSDAGVSKTPRMARASYQAHSQDGPFAYLQDFVQRVQSAPVAPSSSSSSQASPSNTRSVGKDGGGSNWVIILLVVIGAIILLVIGVCMVLRKKKFNDAKERLKEEIDDLVTPISDLMGSSSPAAVNEASTANERHSRAQIALKRADSWNDLETVESIIAKAKESVKEAKRLATFRPRRNPPSRDAVRDEARQAARRRQAATNPPREPVPESQRPQPAATTVINHNYGGTGLGYYPMYGGYGYWDPFGNFMMDMLVLDMMFDTFDHDGGADMIVNENNYYGGEEESEQEHDPSDEDGHEGEHGDEGNEDDQPHDDEAMADETEGSLDDNDPDAGGGGSWADETPNDEGGGGTYQEPEPAYDPPSYDPPADSGGYDSGGGDYGGGGDFGGGGDGGGSW